MNCEHGCFFFSILPKSNEQASCIKCTVGRKVTRQNGNVTGVNMQRGRGAAGEFAETAANWERATRYLWPSETEEIPLRVAKNQLSELRLPPLNPDRNTQGVSETSLSHRPLPLHPLSPLHP